jgi:hypothetical protein
MMELLSILAQAKKQIKHGRLSKRVPCHVCQPVAIPERFAEQFAKKLLKDSVIENILRRLDRLTQDEACMMEAHILEVVHGLMNNMKVVMDGEYPLLNSEQMLRLLSVQAAMRQSSRSESPSVRSKIIYYSFPVSWISLVMMQNVVNDINKLNRPLSHSVYADMNC